MMPQECQQRQQRNAMTPSPNTYPPYELARREAVILGDVLRRAAAGDFPPCECGNPLAGWHEHGTGGAVYCCARCAANEVRHG